MTPFEHQIRERAYFIWEGEGRVIGRSDDHWLRAERELHETAGPMLLQAVAADLTLSPSPTQILDKGLKTRASRARSASAKADETAKTAKPAAKAAATQRSSKSVSTKPAAKAVPVKPAARAKAARAGEASASIH